MNEEDLQVSGAGRHGEDVSDGDSFRRRSRSAPPALWAAKKYGRQLRKMSDEFDTLLDKGVRIAQWITRTEKGPEGLGQLYNLNTGGVQLHSWGSLFN